MFLNAVNYMYEKSYLKFITKKVKLSYIILYNCRKIEEKKEVKMSYNNYMSYYNIILYRI